MLGLFVRSLTSPIQVLAYPTNDSSHALAQRNQHWLYRYPAKAPHGAGPEHVESVTCGKQAFANQKWGDWDYLGDQIDHLHDVEDLTNQADSIWSRIACSNNCGVWWRNSVRSNADCHLFGHCISLTFSRAARLGR